jgi:hypothetical protein
VCVVRTASPDSSEFRNATRDVRNSKGVGLMSVTHDLNHAKWPTSFVIGYRRP